MVGTQQGVVNKQRQGTGLATVLPVPDTDQIEAFAKSDYLQNKAGAAAKKADLDDAWAGINKFNPERWFKHEAILQGKMNGLVQKGADLLNLGINPLKSTDPRALAFRKEQMEIEGVANASKGMRDAFEKTTAKTNGEDPNEYTPASKQAFADYIDTDPEQVAQNGYLPPTLLKTRPNADLQKTWSETMGHINTALNGQQMTEPERWDTVNKTLGNPALAEKLLVSTASAIDQMTAEERKDLADRAKKLGKSETEVLSYDYMRRYEKARDPFSADKFITEGAKTLEVPTTAWNGPDSFSKKADTGQLNKMALEKARIMFSGNPEALIGYEAVLPRDPKDTDAEYRAKAVKDAAGKMATLKAKDRSSGLTGDGQGKQEILASGEQWIKDMRSIQPDKNQKAASFIAETKNIFPGQVVSRAYTIATPLSNGFPGAPGSTQDGLALGQPDFLVLELDGKPVFQKVKESMMERGVEVKEEDFQQNQTSTIIRVSLDKNNENALMKLHDKSFQEGKRPYDPVIKGNPTMSQILGTAPAKGKL